MAEVRQVDYRRFVHHPAVLDFLLALRFALGLPAPFPQVQEEYAYDEAKHKLRLPAYLAAKCKRVSPVPQ